jgi:hypothetical protein
MAAREDAGTAVEVMARYRERWARLVARAAVGAKPSLYRRPASQPPRCGDPGRRRGAHLEPGDNTSRPMASVLVIHAATEATWTITPPEGVTLSAPEGEVIRQEGGT